jgi:hypothetical protein
MENECTQRETEEPLPGSSDQRAPPVLAVEPPRIAIMVSRNYCPAESPVADGEGIAKKNPGNQAGILFNH